MASVLLESIVIIFLLFVTTGIVLYLLWRFGIIWSDDGKNDQEGETPSTPMNLQATYIPPAVTSQS